MRSFGRGGARFVVGPTVPEARRVRRVLDRSPVTCDDPDVETIGIREARRLALARAGLLSERWSGIPRRVRGRGERTHAAIGEVLSRFGYLQLDTVSVAGARSHALVLLSRLEGLDASVCEGLLRPGAPLFEYWGHEASWIPMELYPAFAFRREEYARRSPWWGELLDANRPAARELHARIAAEGPLRSADMEGSSGQGWWDLKLSKKLAMGLWFGGELAIAERVNFQRVYDLTERVIPAEVRARPLSRAAGIEVLLLRALDGHGFATQGTLAATWRLRNVRAELAATLARLVGAGAVVPCELVGDDGKRQKGFARPEHLELADRLRRARFRDDEGVLLSPFDPLLWDRPRVARLFDFDAVLEIFKPAPQRKYGYFCLPVLVGERLVGRFDLKADRAKGRVRVVAWHFEGSHPRKPATAADARAARVALERHADAVGLALTGGPRLDR